METIILILLLPFFILLFVAYRVGYSFGRGKKKEQTPVPQSKIYYRVERGDSGWPVYKEEFWGVIFTFVPYKERVLMVTPHFKTRQEAEDFSRLTLEEFTSFQTR